MSITSLVKAGAQDRSVDVGFEDSGTNVFGGYCPPDFSRPSNCCSCSIASICSTGFASMLCGALQLFFGLSAYLGPCLSKQGNRGHSLAKFRILESRGIQFSSTRLD